MTPELHIVVRDHSDVIAARLEVRHLGFHIGFDERALTAIASALSEVVRDLMAHGTPAELHLTFAMDRHKVGLKVVAHSDEPVATESADAGWGLGIDGARRLMDELVVRSEDGQGTTVTMTKWCEAA